LDSHLLAFDQKEQQINNDEVDNSEMEVRTALDGMLKHVSMANEILGTFQEYHSDLRSSIWFHHTDRYI